MARGKKKNKNWRPKNGPSHEWEFTAAELAAPRPPSWAKGKDIGMWHKAKNRRKFLKGDNDVDDKIGQRKGAKAEKRAPNRCVELTFPVDKVKEIQNMLKTIGVPAPPCVQSTRVKKVQDQYKHVEDSPFKKTFLRCISGNIQDRISSTSLCSLRKDPVLDDQYFNEEKAKPANHKVREMSNFRQRLPAWDKKNQLLTALDQNNVILVTGETGCGKTTQVPQFILEDAVLNGNASQTYIMVTQPRRISAITVAERVANERGERLGQSVGYQIRLEKVMPRSVASILFCTTGVLLQYMHSDPLLTRVSTVVVDEIHERNTISDFVITLLRDIAPRRPDLKIILMSATLNADLFSKYFNDCPTVHIPGFTFNVEEFYLEDVLETVGFRFPFKPKNKKGQKNDLDQDSLFLEAFYRDIESSGKYSKKTVESLKSPESNEINLPLVQQLIEHICTKMGPGAILVFLTGWDKISALNRLLNESGKFPYYRYRIIPLHSLMPTSNQRQVFERPPKGVRKIVLATNIAETSITIDDVVYVIDCGKIKIKNFDVDGNISTLKEEWVSLANARQRRGRAGRVQNGICFHLYSKGREMLLAKDMLPEMLRTRLEEVILQAKILQVGKIERFLQKVIDPPTAKAVELSLKLLADMNAIDDNENLTPLGYHLASLPIDPQAGKMLLFGSLFGILDPISSVAAALSFKDPFVIPLGQEKAVDKIRHSFDADHKSDHLIIAKTIAQYENAVANRTAPKFINDNYLSQSVIEQLRDMKRQLVSLLSDMKFAANPRVDSRENNENSMNIALVRAVVCAGLFPNIAIVEKAKILKNGRAITRVITMDGNQIVEFHPKSIFSSNNVYHSKFVAYFEKLRSSRINLFDSTMVYPMTLIFTCHDLKVHTKSDHKIIDIGHNVHFKASNDLAGVVLELRAWLDWLIEYRMCHPGAMKWGENSDESVVLKAVAELITTDEQIRNRDADDDADADADADFVSDDEDGSCEDDSDVEDVE